MAHARASSHSGRPSRTSLRPVVPLLSIVAAAFIVKLIVLVQLQAHPLLQPRGDLDSGTYLTIARQVAGGDLTAGNRVFFVSPLYVYFVALVLALSGSSVLAVRLIQIVLGTLSVWLIASTARRFYGDRAAWIAAALATLNGYFTFNEILVLQSAIDPFLTALGLWLLARAWSEGRGRAFVAAGAVLGLHVLNRPNTLAWATAAVLFTLAGSGVARPARRGRATLRRSGLAPAALLACGIIATLAPVAIRNYAVAGQFALVASHGGLNFYIGNNPAADGTYRAVPGVTPTIAGQDRDMRRVAEAATGRPLTDAEASSWFYGQAWAWIRTSPRDAAALFARKLLYVFNATDLPLNFSYAYYSHDEPTLLRALIVGPWLLLPVGLAGIWLARPTPQVSDADRQAWWRWIGFVPVYAVSVAVFFVAGRYRLPLLVPLTITAAPVATVLRRRWRAARPLRVTSALLFLAVLAALTNLRLGLDSGLAGERTELILYLIDTRHDEAAAALLTRTEPAHPEPALLLFRAGKAYLSRGEAANAVSLLERALSIEPGRAETRLALGESLLDLGRPRDAAPHLRAALDARIRPDLAAFDLARALAATGDVAGALAALRALPAPGQLDTASQLAAGRLALDLGDAALAASFLQPAAAVDPRNAAVLESLGVALGLLGRRSEAIPLLEDACRIDPTNAAARLNLAAMYAESGRLAEARLQAQEALRLQPDYPRARDLLSALDRRR